MDFNLAQMNAKKKNKQSKLRLSSSWSAINSVLNAFSFPATSTNSSGSPQRIALPHAARDPKLNLPLTCLLHGACCPILVPYVHTLYSSESQVKSTCEACLDALHSHLAQPAWVNGSVVLRHGCFGLRLLSGFSLRLLRCFHLSQLSSRSLFA